MSSATWKIILFGFALSFRLVDMDATSITYDERSAKDSGPWWELMLHGDFSSREWGYAPTRPIFSRWLYGVLPEALWGEKPYDPTQLAGARWVAAILASILVVGVFEFGCLFGGHSMGLISSLTFCFFPAILGHDRLASHDLPARMASLYALFHMVRYFENSQRRSWLFSTFWAGVSFAAYYRVGVQTLMIIQTALGSRWLLQKEWKDPKPLFRILAIGLLTLGLGFVLFAATWPHAWFHPIQAFQESFHSSVISAKEGGNVEWFFGKIRPMPPYYYLLVYLFTTPLLVLLGSFMGIYFSWTDFRKGGTALLLWMGILVPPISAGFLARASLNHYLLLIYPYTCVLAAMGVQNLGKWLNIRQIRTFLRWETLLAFLMIGSEGILAIQLHPFYLEFFNPLIGGNRMAAKKHIFMTGWYGEGINPLLDYVNQKAEPGSQILCCFGPWPGMTHIKKFLRPDLGIQGIDRANPLGADYVLRTEFETCSPIYRYNPNPEIYEKVFDLKVLGGSIGGVWKRRPTAVLNGLVFADDFSSAQISHFAFGFNNLEQKMTPDGKLFPLKPSQPGIALIKIPMELLHGAKMIQIRCDLQIERGTALIQCGFPPSASKISKELHPPRKKTGEPPTHWAPVAFCRSFRGTLESKPFRRPETGDLWIELEMTTEKKWEGRLAEIWEHDWFDSLYIYAR